MDSAIPISVLTGFLGSGKTTLLKSLLAHSDMRDTAVLVNELGEVGLDHLLVREVAEDVVLLGSGCLCCAVRDDLVSALVELRSMRESGSIPRFSRAVVETTGLADPAPIVQTLIGERSLQGYYRLWKLVAAVDAVFGEGELDDHLEAVKQTAMADCLVLTKTDLASAQAVASLRDRVSRINPAARLIESALDSLPMPAQLFDSPGIGDHPGRMSAGQWMSTNAYRGPQSRSARRGRHDERIASFVIRMGAPVAWPVFLEWLELLLASRGENLLRVKGLVNVAGNPRPVVIQGVQHMFYPPTELAAWPDADRRSSIVFITRDLTRRAVEASLEQILGAAFVPA